MKKILCSLILAVAINIPSWADSPLADFILDHYQVGEGMTKLDASDAKRLFWVERSFDGDEIAGLNALRDDMGALCESQGGMLVQDSYFKGNLVPGAFPYAQSHVFEAVADHLAKSELFPMDPIDADREAALPQGMQENFFQPRARLHKDFLSRRVNFSQKSCEAEGALKGYKDALETGGFGHFVCEAMDETIQWEVLIQPVALQGKPCGGQGRLTLFVRMVPYEKR